MEAAADPSVLHVAVLPAGAAAARRLTALLATMPGIATIEIDDGDADVAIVLSDDGLDADDLQGLPVVFVGGRRQRPRAGRAAASGQLGPNPTAAELEGAVRAVAAGLNVFDPASSRSERLDTADAVLTTRECEVLALMAEGLPNKGIAARLGISEHTAKFHVGSVLSKLDAESRAEAVAEGARRGILTL